MDERVSLSRNNLAFFAQICLERYLKKLAGNTDIEDSVQRLDTLTQEEARIASAELMKVTHGVDGKVMGVDDRVKRVDERIQDVSGDMQNVGDKVEEIDGKVQGLGSGVKDISKGVQGMDDKVQVIDGRVQDVGDEVHVVNDKVEDIGDTVQGVGDNIQRLDHKLDHANSSSSFNFPAILSDHSHSIQGTSSKIIFYDGFRLLIHPSIITLLAKYTNKVQPNGSLMEVSSNSGNPLVRSCGYTENVSSS